jgi:hypothetical protein
MRAAINIEAVFAVLVVLACCKAGISRPGAGKYSRSWMLLLLVLPAAYLWTLTIPLLSDDFSHIGNALSFTVGRIPSLFTVPAGDLFFRPLGYISYGIDARWADHSAALWHLSTLLIHFGNCLLVYLLARQKDLGRAFAVTAAVVFGLHGSRPESVTWIACRFDLLATLFVLSTLSLFLASGRRPWLYAVALAAALLALISKEVAYVLPVLLLLITERPQWPRVLYRIAPFAALTSLVFVYRWHVLSGIGGYQTASHTPTIFNFNFLRTLNALFLRLWATLFFPINWTESAQWWLWLGLAMGVAGYAIIGILGGRDRRTIAFLLFTFVAALPAQHLLLISADLEKSRVLYLPSAGFALFLAAALEGLRKIEWRIPSALAIICFQAACLEHNLITWRGVALVAKQACDSVAASMEGNHLTVTVLTLPNVVRGVYFLHEDMGDCLAVWHGIDKQRILAEHGDLLVQWDAQSDAVRIGTSQ